MKERVVTLPMGELIRVQYEENDCDPIIKEVFWKPTRHDKEIPVMDLLLSVSYFRGKNRDKELFDWIWEKIYEYDKQL